MRVAGRGTKKNMKTTTIDGMTFTTYSKKDNRFIRNYEAMIWFREWSRGLFPTTLWTPMLAAGATAFVISHQAMV